MNIKPFTEYFDIPPTRVNILAVIDRLKPPARDLAFMIATQKRSDQIIGRLAKALGVSLEEAYVAYELLEDEIRRALKRAGVTLREDLNPNPKCPCNP